ncbi:MAG: uridine kinase [Edaphobacter sp.]|uniref:uridine kinase n=1 Tax=Edaphobacter sp. TaxID=1934404 RepID=UPI0023A6955D|nr:uridine kinase [Edaphobacter sp.]MDE1175494.1 uridine kinase [Edaphobacter sp.]
MTERNDALPQQLSFHRRPLIIGIAGCSGSGKTTLARELTSQLAATLLPLDFYYICLGHLPPDERALQNFDHPDSLEHSLLARHIEDLAAGNAIERPIYDFTTHTRVRDRTSTIESARVLIVEGILALHYAELRTQYDFSIYVNAPNEICLNRRIYRDMRERGRTEESVRAQFEATAKPMADLYVIPSAQHASVTVEGTDALDWSVEQVLKRMRELGMLRG